ncbi:MAG: nucleoside 2-deoxyribosyltransferase [Rhodospirillales bacterium]|nr:nucleoside 2-deoxyribosyltransferase [Rhodospirillales bacterium]
MLDGANVDEGVAFEIGFVHALGKLCVGLQTDIRRQLPTGNNPMIGRSLSKIFFGVGDLIDWAEKFSSRFKIRQSAISP